LIAQTARSSLKRQNTTTAPRRSSVEYRRDPIADPLDRRCMPALPAGRWQPWWAEHSALCADWLGK
jgi:hypothetical protein